MKIKLLAPGQTIDGKPVKQGSTVEPNSNSVARQLISSGYAVEVESTPKAQKPEAPKSDPTPKESK